MRADEAGEDDLGVVQDEEVVGLEQAGKIPNLKVTQGLGRAIQKEETGRVARVGGLGGDLDRGKSVGQKGGKSGERVCRLTIGVD